MYLFDSRIRYSETDCDGKLTLISLLNYFQDCSTFQSEDLGMGVDYMQSIDKVWLMSSWQIVVNRYPRLGEKVSIGTLPYEFKGFMGHRNFVMFDEFGNQLAVANSLWSLINMKTWRPAMPDERMLKGYRLEERLDMNYAPRKIAIPEKEGEKPEAIAVRKHHIDTNHHVNNGQYVNIAMDLLPEGFEVGQLRAEYKKQAFLDDVFYPYIVTIDDRTIISLNDEKGEAYFISEFTRKDG